MTKLTLLPVLILLLLHGFGFAPRAAAGQEIKLLALGDSLFAGYGLAPGQSFADQLQRRLAKDGHKVKVINAGVSGDTSAGGLARLDWVLADAPQAAWWSWGPMTPSGG
jgi:acyl-CoA thioesterase-1